VDETTASRVLPSHLACWFPIENIHNKTWISSFFFFTFSPVANKRNDLNKKAKMTPYKTVRVASASEASF
jgi:hypothetical protein